MNTATIKVKVDDKELKDLNKELNKTAGEGFDRIAKSAQNTAKLIRGGFDIAIGASALFGEKTKSEFEELANKSIILANSFAGVGDVLEVVGGAGKAMGNAIFKGFQTASTGAKIFKVALAGIGLGTIAFAIDYVISNFEKLIDMLPDWAKKGLQNLGLIESESRKVAKAAAEKADKDLKDFEKRKAREGETRAIMEEEIRLLKRQEAAYTQLANTYEKGSEDRIKAEDKAHTAVVQYLTLEKKIKDQNAASDAAAAKARDERIAKIKEEIAEVMKEASANKIFDEKDFKDRETRIKAEYRNKEKALEAWKVKRKADINTDVKDQTERDQLLLDLETAFSEGKRKIAADRVKALKDLDIEAAQAYTDAALGAGQELANFYTQISNMRLEQIQKEKDARLEALDAERQLALGIYSESEKDRAIIEEKYRQRRLAEEEKAAVEEKKIRKRQADVELAITLSRIIAETAFQAIKNSGNPILLALSLVTGAASAATAVAQRAAVSKLAQGGMLVGPSHANGGIYMGGGVEAEGGEAVINKRSSRMFGGLLSAVNQAGGGVPIMPGESIKGGINTTSSTIIDYDALASAMARNPVKAFVVTQDITLAQDKQTAIQSKATIA